MKRLLVVAVVGLLSVSAATAIAGDRRDRERDRQKERDKERRWSRLWLVSSDGPRFPGSRTTFLQVPPPAPAPNGQSPLLTPTPDVYPVPEGPGYVLAGPIIEGPLADPGAMGLFPCVEYEDLDHIHPCAVTRIIAVKDPRPKCDCDPSGCVYIAVCVPKNICPKIKVDDDGEEMKLDFGDYQVEIESKKGKVYVDYDD